VKLVVRQRFLATRNMSTRKDHYHQCRPDRQGRNNAAPAGNDCASDCQDQKKRVDQFRYLFITIFLEVSRS
jgi:hypothetical protein